MADLGVDADLEPADFLAAMDGYRGRDPERSSSPPSRRR
jgi:hypothetical protein